MDLDALKAALPEHAKDLKLNLGAVLRSEHLSDAQVWGAALASAHAARHADTIRALEHGAAAHLDETGLRAARAASSIMAMNNVYYRFTHLVHDDEVTKLPARLRMQVMANPGVPAQDFELWSLAVSAIHGCGMCMDAHTRKARGEGVKPEAVQDVIRVAAVVHAVAVTLDGEAARATAAA